MKDIGKRIINYTQDKLFFPKVVVIDKPGIIINRISKKYTSGAVHTRIAFFFEDIFVDVQVKSREYLGYERSAIMWRRLGLRFGTLYMDLSNAKKIPHLLAKPILEYVFRGFRSNGMTLAIDPKIDLKNNLIILEGHDNMFCRKSGIYQFFAGTIEGAIGLLLDKELEARFECEDCPKHCKALIKIKNEQFKRLDKAPDLTPPPMIAENEHNLREFHSFSDLIRFKKIGFDIKGKFHFNDITITASPFDFFRILIEEFRKEGIFEPIKADIIKSAFRLAGDLIEGEKTKKGSMNALLKIICALGWGIPAASICKGSIVLRIRQAPSGAEWFTYHALVINGFLNYALKKEYHLASIEDNGSSRLLIKYVL